MFTTMPFIGEQEKAEGSVKVCTLGIEGMTCHSCVSLIESTVGEMRGVVGVAVSLGERRGTVKYHRTLVTPEEIKNTVEDMRFIVTSVTGNDIFQISISSSRYVGRGKEVGSSLLDPAQLFGNTHSKCYLSCNMYIWVVVRKKIVSLFVNRLMSS